MEYQKLIRTRRSIRGYRSEPVPEDALQRVLDAARVAPTAANRQPWHFVVVRDEENKQKLATACAKQSWLASDSCWQEVAASSG